MTTYSYDAEQADKMHAEVRGNAARGKIGGGSREAQHLDRQTQAAESIALELNLIRRLIERLPSSAAFNDHRS